VYSVDTEEEAEQLIVAACPRDYAGKHYARELVNEQTLSNLAQFSQKLHNIAQRIAARAGAR
jgi:hypothetical protein